MRSQSPPTLPAHPATRFSLPSSTAKWVLALFALALALALPTVALADEGGDFKAALNEGIFSAAAVALGAGFLTSLTPCVYPMIAITVSVFGAKQAKTRGHAMMLSTAFVGGMVVLFTAMFVVVSLTGGVFGAILANRWVIVGISVVFIIMAASMFGAFELTLPDSVMQRLSGVGGVGYGGAFSLGLVSGLVAAPCSGPVLISMMAVVTEKQSVSLGVTFGMAYAIGLGALFWVVGTFAAGLPKGGRWMVWVKSFFGIVMLVLALYYLKNAFPVLGEFVKNDTKFLLIAAIIGAVGLGLGAVHVNWDDGGVGTKIRKGLGITGAVAGGFLLVTALGKPKEVSAEVLAKKEQEQRQADEAAGRKSYPALKKEHWGSDLQKALETAKAEQRPLLLDFGAEWCGACKELEAKTFSDADFQAKSGRFVAVKFDATNEDDPKVKETMEKYKVKGLPAVLVFDSTGAEVKRVEKFIPAKDFLAVIEPVN
ncbi:MAG: thioredoxin family protein [Polyangiaceae bacterium]|jgi:thiol:disulfide interchange protein DsbD|nr:thioredoxin family protein [Polyangiaceae bacterium]